MKNKIETGLVDFLAKNMGFSPEKIDALAFKNMTLGELYLDSLMLLELGIFLEEEFGIALDPALLHVDSDQTVGTLIDRLAERN